MNMNRDFHFLIFFLIVIDAMVTQPNIRYRSNEILHRSRRMLGGRRADPAEWSFIVSLTFKQPSAPFKICSGALISRYLVITAAHCVEDIKNQPHYLTVTVNKASTVNSDSIEKREVFGVAKIATHDLFNLKRKFLPKEVFSWDFDIAVVRLNRSAPRNLSKIFLSSNGLPKSKTSCKSAGWGSTSELQNINDTRMMNYDVSTTLHEINVPIVPWKLCHDFFTPSHREFKKYNLKVFCGGKLDKTGKHDVGGCIGDSGSPLVCQSDQGMVLHGIMLGGHPLCTPGNSYMIFTNVSKFRNWITKTVIDLRHRKSK